MSLANAASRDLPPWRALLRRLNIFGFTGRSFVILAPAAWLTLFFLIPLAVVFKISLSEAAIARPPYLPMLTFGEDGSVQLSLHLSNYLFLLSDS